MSSQKKINGHVNGKQMNGSHHNGIHNGKHPLEKIAAIKNPTQFPQIGILEWFHIGDYNHVERTLDDLKKLNITHLRTGISWADFHTKEGDKWYEWLVPYLSESVELLPCFCYTPPSMGLAPKTSSPPKEPKLFADFLDVFVAKHGKHFEWVELWNEPNNQSEYDFTLDTRWQIFCEMIGGAAYWIKHLGKKTVLGGMSPVDVNWLNMMGQRGVLKYIDAVGVHGFPDVFDNYWEGWPTVIDKVRRVVERYNEDAEIWITETGFSTWQFDEKKQLKEFLALNKSGVKKAYWYSLYDLKSDYPTIDGFHLDEREYHFGLKKSEYSPKLLFRLMEEGFDKLPENEWMTKPYVTPRSKKNSVVITGGAGFIGTNLAKRLLSLGQPVTILDNLSRPGVEKNIRMLKSQFPKNLQIEIADVRNTFELKRIMQSAEFVYHFAAQVAVTTSLIDPVNDFSINAQGTLNVLEAAKNSPNKPPVLLTSTNKVYGGLDDIALQLKNDRYAPLDEKIDTSGVNEKRKLDFYSPYGGSKGAADQYVIDYSRSFGLKTVVFRMSCIYGLHQFGTEDQGWVAHFLIQALKNNPITIYGDGKQVRDILFVEDLVNAFLLARENIEMVSGEAFNIGGGPSNAISLLQLIEMMEELTENKIQLKAGKWRVGDQKYYVSDISKFKKLTGWHPEVSASAGVRRLYQWLREELYEREKDVVKPLEQIA